MPGLHALLRRGTGGTNSARYCYSVWLRHLVRNRRAGMHSGIQAMAELGPGDSLGIGLAALLSGAESYVALDAVPHARADTNAAVFEELVRLFRDRSPIPGDDEFPNVWPRLEDYAFPHDLLPTDLIEITLRAERVARLRRDLRDLSGSIRYCSQWWSGRGVEPDSVDLIVSQAVLEHVNDVPKTYEAMYMWMRPGALMSHQIDLQSHQTSEMWNGHLGYSDRVWRIMRGRLPYLLNRISCSGHLAAAADAGFTTVTADRVIRNDGMLRSRLAPRFRDMAEIDLQTSGVFMQCCK